MTEYVTDTAWRFKALEKLQAENDKLKAEVGALRWGVELGGAMLNEGYLMKPGFEDYTTCVYCDKMFKNDTPEGLDNALKAHIEVCPKHPVSALKAGNKKLEGRIERATLWVENCFGDGKHTADCKINSPDKPFCNCYMIMRETLLLQLSTWDGNPPKPSEGAVLRCPGCGETSCKCVFGGRP